MTRPAPADPSALSPATAPTRTLTLVLLALALLVGAYLRFNRLDAREMSADEGASWAAAIAPTVADVLQLQPRLNPGEFGLHDLALHAWIRFFGDNLFAIRSLSALAGTISIILVFLVARELFQLDVIARHSEHRLPTNDHKDSLPRDQFLAKGEIVHSVPALAALLFAVNLVTIKYSQEARMYPLALALMLAQTCFFLRAIRVGGPTNYLGAAIFTSASVSATLTSGLLLLPEGLWLFYLLAIGGVKHRRDAVLVAFALGGGLILLAPIAQNYLRTRGGVPDANVYNWISRPELWAPFSVFNKATGSFAFPVMAMLALWGVIRNWRGLGSSVHFALLWMFAAPIFLLLFSYAVRPAFVERYVLACFVPFFVLVGLGAWSFDSFVIRVGAVTLITALALGHVVEFNRRPHDAQWREATALSVIKSGREKSIAVAPRYAVNVVRYYLAHGPTSNAIAVGYDTPAAILIFADTGLGQRERAQLARTYPQELAHMRGLVVRGH